MSVYSQVEKLLMRQKHREIAEPVQMMTRITAKKTKQQAV
jgi:hypothetical protein